MKVYTQIRAESRGQPDTHIPTVVDYLEVSHHDEASSTDPRGGEAGRVEDAVLMLLDHVGVTQQTNQHH